MALPANVDTGLVTGRFLVGVIDGPDSDDEPDGIAAQGTITFTASVPYLPNPTATPAPVTILKAPIVAILDEDGYLCVPKSDGAPGARGVRLVATDDPDLSVQRWTWTVTYKFEVVNGVRPVIASHSMALPAGPAVDLTTVVAVPSSTGIGLEQAEALAAAAGIAATTAQADAARAADAAERAADAAAPTDTGVATLVTYGGQTTTVLDTNYRRDITPAMYGAVGDGVADDTAAVRAVINTGQPVHWGGPEKTYRITEPLAMALTRPLVWRADGATIKGDYSETVERMFTVTANGNHATITGPLTLDANRVAHDCIQLWNRAELANFTSTDLSTINAHRASTAMQGGNGIEVSGAWERIAMTRPTVRNITMAPGAGVVGAYGVSGIYIREIKRGDGSSDTPHMIRIDDPYIENIQSEDPDWMVDQDGIRVFGGDNVPGQLSPIITQVVIAGGEVRNSRGRAVKAQTHLTTVDGLRIVRTEGGKGAAPDVDFQVGGGTARNIETSYENGNVPLSVVNFSGAREPRLVPQRQVAGLKVLMSGSAAPDRIVGILSFGEERTLTTISDLSVHHDGALPDCLIMMQGVSGVVQDLVVSNVAATASKSAVRVQGGSLDGWDARIVVSAAINTGVTVPLVNTVTPLARHTATLSGVVGFTA